MKKALVIFLVITMVLSTAACDLQSDSLESDKKVVLNISDISSAVALDTPGGFAYINAGHLGINNASIKIQNDLIYVKSALSETENFVSCFQVDGKKLWEMPFERWAITVYPLLDDSCIIEIGGELFHINPNGEIDWQTQQYSGIKSCMVQPDGTVLYIDGEYLGRVLPDGSLEQIALAPPSAEELIPFFDGSFCIRDKKFSNLYGYDASCNELWSYSADYSLKNAVKTNNGDVITSGNHIIRLLDQNGNLLKELLLQNDPIHSVHVLNDSTIAVFSENHVYLLDAALNVLKEIPVDSSLPANALKVSFFNQGLTVLESGGFAVHYASAFVERDLNPLSILRVYQYNQDGEMVDKLHCTFNVENAFPDIYIDTSGRIFYENPPGIELRET